MPVAGDVCRNFSGKWEIVEKMAENRYTSDNGKQRTLPLQLHRT
jgi:hypothetical protein